MAEKQDDLHDHKESLPGNAKATKRGAGARAGAGCFPYLGPWTKSHSITCDGPAIFFRNNLPKEKHLWLLICLNSVLKFLWSFPLAGLDICLQFVVHLAQTFYGQTVAHSFPFYYGNKALWPSTALFTEGLTQPPDPTKLYLITPGHQDGFARENKGATACVVRGLVMGEHLCIIPRFTLRLHPAL